MSFPICLVKVAVYRRKKKNQNSHIWALFFENTTVLPFTAEMWGQKVQAEKRKNDTLASFTNKYYCYFKLKYDSNLYYNSTAICTWTEYGRVTQPHSTQIRQGCTDLYANCHEGCLFLCNRPIWMCLLCSSLACNPIHNNNFPWEPTLHLKGGCYTRRSLYH